MIPVFEFDSFISEESYRKVIKRKSYNIGWIISMFLGLFCIGYTIRLLRIYIAIIRQGGTPPYVIYFLCFLFIGIFTIVSNLKAPKRNADKVINQLIMETGSSDINQHLSFFEDKIELKNNSTGNKIYFNYDMIKKVLEYNDFIVLIGDSNGVYVSKKNIPDGKAFNDFLWSKCIDAKYKKVNN